jgi:glucokinase
MVAGPALAFDLGGTNLRAAIVDAAGSVLRRAAVPTDTSAGPSAVIAQIMQLSHQLGGLDHTAAVGIAAPGPLDSEAGRIFGIATLPGWENYPLRDVLAGYFGRPVMLENDGIAAAFGEWRFGAGRGLNHVIYVTVSTGIGGGVIADGRVLRGRYGMAGHIGHMMMSADGPRCGCGGTGCFEALASGTAFGATARAAGFDSASAAVSAARAGDAAALALVAREAQLLGYGFASLLHLYAPQRLVIGGGVSDALDLMQAGIRGQIERHAMPAYRDIEVVKAELGDNSGLVGAATLALHGAR